MNIWPELLRPPFYPACQPSVSFYPFPPSFVTAVYTTRRQASLTGLFVHIKLEIALPVIPPPQFLRVCSFVHWWWSKAFLKPPTPISHGCSALISRFQPSVVESGPCLILSHHLKETLVTVVGKVQCHCVVEQLFARYKRSIL